MKTIAVIDADFERGPLGTPSRLRASLAGEAVVRRTMRRVLKSQRLASVHLVVQRSQERAAREAIGDLPVHLETHDAGLPPWQAYVASSRKWAPDGWRGGITNTSVFDETLHPWVAEALGRREQADIVAILPGAAAILDPALLDAMVEHYGEFRDDVRLTFTQCPPGLSACLYSTALLRDLADGGQFIGRVMGYRPVDPQRDMNVQPCFYPLDNQIAHVAGRCLADTAEGFERLARMLGDLGEAIDARAASAWITEHRLDAPVDVLGVPGDVEIELTTQDSLPNTTLRPRGDRVPARGPMSEDCFRRIIEGLSVRDDARVVLGGFGDPLLHLYWPRFVRIAREAGILGVAIRTPAVTLDDAALERLLESRVDLVNVLLDAHAPETYAELHGVDRFEQVNARIEAILVATRTAQRGGIPIVACEMLKTRRTMGEMEAFYDHWLNKGCGAIIAGPSAYAGLFPDGSVMDMSPPARFACSRLWTRAMVLADGRVTLCDQDFTGAQVVGDVSAASLAEIWRGASLSQARQAHVEKRWGELPLCSACREWHRP